MTYFITGALIVLGLVTFFFPKKYFTEQNVGALYPTPPPGVQVSAKPSANDFTCIGKITVSLDATNTATYHCWGIPLRK